MLILVPDGTVCFNQPFLEECFKSRGMCFFAPALCFMLCIRCTVSGHISHLIFDQSVRLILWMLDMNRSFISKMRSLFFSLLNLLKGDKMITHYCMITKKEVSCLHRLDHLHFRDTAS